MPFLTDIDSRAAIRGSRDPLGLVPVWSHFGRRVVGNVTTVSNSVRGFTTLLLGYYFADEVRTRDGADAERALDVFLKFEQLAGYSRWFVNKDDAFRGRDRVVLRLQDSSNVTLGADPSNQILGNQKIYGLWGLFSVPARESGLLMKGEPSLTPVAREFVEKHYISPLTRAGFKGGRPVTELLRRKRGDVHLAGTHASLARTIAGILGPDFSEAEKSFYEWHLVDGGPEDSTSGCQPLLSDLIDDLPPDTGFDMHELRAVTKRARSLGGREQLASHLGAIEKLEALLVPMENAFAFALTRDTQGLTSIAGDLRKEWGPALKHVRPAAISDLRPGLATAIHDDGAAERFVACAEAFASGDYLAALHLLLEHNASVMQSRNGSQPWARLEGGKIDVRYRDEAARLIPGDDLPSWWRNTYFINSLKDVVSALKAA